MWIIAGALLGTMLLAGLVGLHTGPHTHLLSVLAGLAAGGWLVAMAVAGHGSTLLYLLLGADLALSAGLGMGAWRALRPPPGSTRSRGTGRLEGSEGIAISSLQPEGVVRVRGEEWSARSLNGPITKGSTIQVIRADGVRLEVWGDNEGGAT